MWTVEDVWCDGGIRALLPPRQWAALTSLGWARTYQAGERLMTEGEADTRVVVLLSGRVKVTSNEEDGTEVLLAIRGPGDIVGERSAIDHGVRSATVTALRRCSTRVLTASQFMGFIGEHDLPQVMLRFGVARQREGQVIRIELSTLPVSRRLVRTLLRLADVLDDRSGGAVSIDVGIPQEELAHAIGASRSQFSVHLARLRAAGIIATGRRRIVVLDRARLRAEDAP